MGHSIRSDFLIQNSNRSRSLLLKGTRWYFLIVSTLAEIESAVEKLPLAEQEELLKRLTVKLAGTEADEFPFREDHMRLLDERFAAYRHDPQQASIWEEVKSRFRARRT